MSPRLHSTALWIFLLTFSVRIYVVARLFVSPFFVPDGGDMKFYSDWGLRVAHGIFTDHQAFYGLPGYPFLLGILYKFLNFDKFGVSVLAGLIQSAADAFTAVCIWKIALEAFPKEPEQGEASPGKAIGCVAAIGWMLYQPAQSFAAILMPTALAVAVFWYCVLVLMRRRDGAFSFLVPWLPIGLLIGFACMTVATVLFLVPMVFVAIFLRFRQSCQTSWLRPLAAAAIFVAGLYAGASPCWIHNYFIAREPVMLSAHSGLNFYIGNNPYATGYPRTPPGMSASQQGMLSDSITFAEKAAGHPLKHYEVSRYWTAQAHNYIASHPVAWLQLMGRKFLHFWDAFQYDDLSLITMFSHAGVLPPGPRFGFVAALAIPGQMMALFQAPPRAGWIIDGQSSSTWGALMPVFVTERYRLAAVPGLLLLGVYGLWEFWGFLSRARWLPAVSYAAAGLVVAFFVATPPADASLWSLDYYNSGIKATDQGDYQTARGDLKTAYRYVPDNSEINFALGLLWQDQGDVRRAETFYGRAIELNPRHLSAWNNLGVLAVKNNAWTFAQRCLRRALEIDPSDAKAHFLQARVFAQLGQWDQAQTHIQAALRLSPGQKEFLELAARIASRTVGK